MQFFTLLLLATCILSPNSHAQGHRSNLQAKALLVDYNYDEPTVMEINGTLSGIGLGWRYYPNKSNYSFLTSIEYLSGNTTYEGTYMSSGKKTPEIPNQDYYYTIASGFGSEVFLKNNYNSLDWSGGVAYRYLENKNSSRDREQTYLYLPLEAGWNHYFKNNSTLRLSYQYDFFILGKNKTHWEQVNAKFNTVEYTQKNGSGNKLSLSVKKEIALNQYTGELFYQSWNIADSDVQTLKYKTGKKVRSTDGGTYKLQEPENETDIIGLAFGVVY